MQFSRWFIFQVGARRHYAEARAIHGIGMLARLYTDAWVSWGKYLPAHSPVWLHSLGARYHADIPRRLVKSFTWGALLQRAQLKACETKRPQYDRSLWYLSSDRWFTRSVVKDLRTENLNADTDIFYGYASASLETIEFAKSKGIFTVVDQFSPARVEEDIVFREREKWPGWERQGYSALPAFYERLSLEWEKADLIRVNAAWTKRALICQGVPEAKIITVPPAIEGLRAVVVARNFHSPLIVLWVGSVSLRKGIPYLIEAARNLGGTQIKFVVAGNLEIDPKKINDAPRNMTFLGHVPRSHTRNLFESAHVFVLPTVSDNFAFVQLEAMAHGLPVVTTPMAGDAVENGVEGFIVPACDASALTEALRFLDTDRELLSRMSVNAKRKVDAFSFEKFTNRILFEMRTAATAKARKVCDA